MSNNNWSGKGLPSVGQMVLRDGFKCKVAYIGNNNLGKVVYLCFQQKDEDGDMDCGMAYWAGLEDLHSLPDPQEPAKQKAIEGMLSYVPELTRLPNDIIYELKEFAKTLHQAGYSADKPKWVSLPERFPPENSDVLVYSNDIITSWVDIAQYHIEDNRVIASWQKDGVDYPCIITHWMPLPPKPKEKQ